MEEFCGHKSGEWANRQKKEKTERTMGAGRRTRDSKVESNDSPEIPDRGDIRHPRPPFGTENRWVKLV